MAQVKYNVITHGLSGKVGDLVIFSQRHGKTILGKLKTQSATPSEDQLAVREKFKLAARYAKSATNDPVINEIYASRAGGGVTPYNLAFADLWHRWFYLNTNAYTGADR